MARLLSGLVVLVLLVGGLTAPGALAAEKAAEKAAPKAAEVQKPAPAAKAAPVNVNTASAAELEKVPGIGPVTAASVVAHRTAKGPFAKAEDLLQVKGIGPKTLEKIRPHITL